MMQIGIGLGILMSAGRRVAPAPPTLLEQVIAMAPAALYYPADVPSMYQLSDGTTAVADGDPVGRLSDLSGNNRHLLQATTASRPVYGTAGGLHWVVGNGTSHFLQNTFSEITGSRTTVISANPNGAAGDIWEITVRRQDFRYSGGQWLVFSNAAGSTVAPAAKTVGNTVPVVVRHVHDAGVAAMSVNNDTPTTIADAGTLNTTGFFMCSRSAAAGFSAIRLYFAVHFNRVLTSGELAVVQELAAEASGATLA